MKDTNKFNQKTGKRLTSPSLRTNLRELSEFHPRLSMRAASTSSSKINEDSLVLIQQKQQQKPPTISSTTNESLFQGEDLMANLTQFVDSNGLIKETADFQCYAQLMQCENGPSQQILLLKIIIATLNSNQNIAEKIVKCESLMIILSLWLSSVEPEKLLESHLIEKLLEVLSRLNFKIDQLVKYKFGRIIKKIVQHKDKQDNNLNFQIALKIFNAWNILASESEISAVPRKKFETENNYNLNNDISIAVISTDHISEITRKRSISTDMSDDFYEKKLKIGATSTNCIANSEPQFNSPKVKKSVSFPNTAEKLCKIIFFERAPEEYEFLSDGSASRDSYIHADRGEASLAFEQFKELTELDDSNVSMKPWKTPGVLEGYVEVPEGSESEEKIIQHQRERTVLSVTYFNFCDIPSNPLEVNVDEDRINDSNNINLSTFTCKMIPIRTDEIIIKHQISIKKAPSLVIPEIFNTSDVFNSFVTNNYALNSLMNPFASVSDPPSSGNFFTNFNAISSNSIDKIKNDNNNQYINDRNRSYKPPERNSYRRESHNKNEFDFKRQDSSSFSEKLSNESISGYNFNPNFISKNNYKEKECVNRTSSLSSSLARSKKINCRHYRPGRPDSCELGSTCRFAHQDYH